MTVEETRSNREIEPLFMKCARTNDVAGLRKLLSSETAIQAVQHKRADVIAIAAE